MKCQCVAYPKQLQSVDYVQVFQSVIDLWLPLVAATQSGIRGKRTHDLFY